MTNQAALTKMSSDANYPNDNGISLSQHSTAMNTTSTILMTVNLLVGGTPGSGSPKYKLQVLTPQGDWVDVLNGALTATGCLSKLVEGKAVRLNAANGSSPGTGNNTPRYYLNVNKYHSVSTGA